MPLTGGTFSGAVSFISSQTFDGRDLSADGAKLDGIEAGATADQTASEIKTAYESNADTNAFTDADQTKLAGLEANADVTDAANVEPLIDAHLNYSTATSGQFLKYNGTDYEWGTVDLTPYLALSGGTMTGTLNVPTIDFGDWTITESGGVLYFANGGTNKMKLDARKLNSDERNSLRDGIMANQIQIRGGTTAEHATFTGAVREITVDTDKDTVVVHDGTTAGGHPLVKAADMSTKAELAGSATQDFSANTMNTTTLDLGDWTITQNGSTLKFTYQGTDKFSISDAGAIVAADNITAQTLNGITKFRCNLSATNPR